MTDIRVAAIVLQYGRADLTRECIASLRRQSYPVEVWLVDNASPGLTAAARSGLAALADASEFLPENLGYAAANNLVIRRLVAADTHDAVLILNNDTVLPPECAAQLVAALARHPRAAQVVPQIRDPGGRLQAAGGEVRDWACEPRLRGHHAPDPASFQTEMRVEYAPGMAILARIAAIRAAGDIPEQFFLYAEDVAWSWKLARAGWETWYTPDAWVTHHESGSTGLFHPVKGYYLFRANVLLARERDAPARSYRRAMLQLAWKLVRQSAKHCMRPRFVLAMWQGYGAGLRGTTGRAR